MPNEPTTIPPATPEQLQMAMFDCTVADLRRLRAERQAEDGAFYGPLGVDMRLAVSILSDAQELIARGDREGARRAINRAKFLCNLNANVDS